MSSLKNYKKKRNLAGSPEPSAGLEAQDELRFVIQKHKATRLHYDLRLELDGVYKSWAIPKGPSLNPSETRLAIYVEDHPLSYGTFEGVIPPGHYGAGTVIVWDNGTYRESSSKDRDSAEKALRLGLKKGSLHLEFFGQKLRGAFILVRSKKANEWLFIKKQDAYSSYKDVIFDERSVITQGHFEDIEAKDSLLVREQSQALLPLHVENLSKQKEGTSESFPTKLKPMQGLQVKPSFTKSKDWLFEKIPNGLHVLLYLKEGIFKVLTKDFIPYRIQSEALTKALKASAITAVLDAIVVNPGSAKESLFLFDILHDSGLNLRLMPLSKRKEVLVKLDIDSKLIKVSKGSKNLTKVLEEKTSSEDFTYIARHQEGFYRCGQMNSTYYRIQIAGSSKAEKEEAKVIRAAPAKAADEQFHPLPKMKVFEETKSQDTISIKNGPLLTSLTKVLWPDENITKGEILEYYKKTASLVVKYLKDRPLSLNRYPHGITHKSFYQKNITGYHPKWLATTNLPSRDHSVNYALCQNEESLLYLINLGCIEIHAWLSTIQALEYPNQCVIDIDPSPELPFSQSIDLCLTLYEMLSKLGLPSYPKTSGGKGMHIFIPLVPVHTFEEVRTFLKLLFEKVHKYFTGVISIDKNPNHRKGKIYLDYLQNTYGQTMASAYCVRPKALAPISCPLAWHEITAKLRPEQFHLRNMLERLAKVGDLWHGMSGKGVRLEKFQKNIEKILT